MKILKRIAQVVLVLILTPILLLLGAVGLDVAVGGGRVEKITNQVAPGVNGGPDVHLYVARPQGEGPFPVVVMIHEFYGLNQSIISRADGLAEEGYLVVAPDVFRGATTELIPRAIYLSASSRPEQVNADLDSVHAWLLSQPDVDAKRIGILGFCFGGRVSLGYSLHNDQLAATVIFYGSSVTDPQVLKGLPGPVLGIFGGADSSIPLEKVQALESGLESAGIPHEITVYDNQPHAFVGDMASIRQGGAQQEAWNQMLRFLEKNLKTGASTLHPEPVAYLNEVDWYYYFMLAYEHAFGMKMHGAH